MTDIVQMSKDGKKFYPQTHVQAVIGLQDSLVGTNLLTGTSSDLKTKQLTNDYNVGKQATNGDFKIKVVKGQTYMYRAWLDNTNGPDRAYVYASFIPIGSAKQSSLGIGVYIEKGETGYSALQITPTEDGYVKLIPFSYANPETVLAGWKEEKFEKGSLATDYSLNPEDILTNEDVQTAITNALGKVAVINVISQADYDKLADKSGVYFIKG